MTVMRRKWSNSARLVAPALLAALAACDDGSEARGPDAVSEGEAAALADAEEMLDMRPAGEVADEQPASADGND